MRLIAVLLVALSYLVGPLPAEDLSIDPPLLCEGPSTGLGSGIIQVGATCSSTTSPATGGAETTPNTLLPVVPAVCEWLASIGRECIRPIDLRVEPLAPARTITINDLARFRPIVGELVVQPDGWGVVGTPTNFYATAETHTMDGELFDNPIEVRWTPSSYVFAYGDGAVETTDASGSAWRGTEESWTETATSHVYAERDDVTASLTVVFTAEVDAGGGWFAVPGTLPVEAPSVSVKVFEVDTVLTNGDCMSNPTAAGCG